MLASSRVNRGFDANQINPNTIKLAIAAISAKHTSSLKS
jgi:hypothetical protein